MSNILNRARAASKRLSRKNLYEWLKTELNTPETDLNILNIGSSGEIDEIIRASSHRAITSIDIDPARMPDIVMDACNMRFAEDSFDIVCIMEVLEHIPTPQLALNEALQVLKPGGKLVLSVPFIFGIHDAPND